MAYWDEVVQFVLGLTEKHGPAAFDLARRVYLLKLHKYTKRNIIIYAMNDDFADVSIEFSDVHGMMAVMPGLEREKNLDIILHSGGGSGEAAKAIMDYLRQKFDHIRVIVPTMAMSAATLLSCGADEIVMGRHSFLGPIDPQLPLLTPTGFRFAAAQDILNQFEMAKKDLKEGAPLEAWSPMLVSYGPDLLSFCQSAKGLTQDIAKTLLTEHMFKHKPDDEREQIAEKISELQDLVCSIFHVITLTFQFLKIKKLIENHDGLAYISTSTSFPCPVPGQIPPFGRFEDDDEDDPEETAVAETAPEPSEGPNDEP